MSNHLQRPKSANFMVAHRTATLIMRQIVLKLSQTRDLGMSSRPAVPDCYQKFVLSYMIAHLGRSTLSLPPSRWQLKIAKNVVGRAYTINIEGAQRYQQQLFLIDRTTNPTIRPPFGCRRRARPDDEEVLGQTTLIRWRRGATVKRNIEACASTGGLWRTVL